MATLGTTTVLGDLTVTGTLKAEGVNSGSGDYVPTTGGTMTGDLTIQSTSPVTLSLLPTDNIQGQGAQIVFGSTDNQHVRIRANHYDSIRSPFGFHIEKCSPNTQTGKAYLEVEGDIFVKEGTRQVATMLNANGYDGLTTLDGNATNWIRTTVNGMIPYQSGGASSLGTSSWPFSAVYANTLVEGGTSLSNKYLSLSGGTLSGALNFANATLNKIGDDAFLGDNNVAGCVCIKGNNGATGLTFIPYSGSITQTLRIDGANTMTLNGCFRSDNEIQTSSANAFRAAYGNYGFFIRQDGANTYFLLTNSGDPYGGWNSLRPIIISNSTGNVSSSHALTIGSSDGNVKRTTISTASPSGGINHDVWIKY